MFSTLLAPFPSDCNGSFFTYREGKSKAVRYNASDGVV
jgi:hypothetical protein